jgi:hypothetical protein
MRNRINDYSGNAFSLHIRQPRQSFNLGINKQMTAGKKQAFFFRLDKVVIFTFYRKILYYWYKLF